MNPRLASLWKKEFLHMKREPLFLIIFFSAVTLQLILFGFAANSRPSQVPLVLWDEDQSPYSRGLVGDLVNPGAYRLQTRVTDEASLREQLRLGKAEVGVHIPADFSRQLLSGEVPKLKVWMDGSNLNAAFFTRSVLTAWMQSLAREFSGLHISSPSETPSVDPEFIFVHNPRMKGAYFMIPGMIGNVLALILTPWAAAAFFREKEIGTLAGLQMSPMTPTEYFWGKAVPLTAVGFFHAAVAYVVAVMVFGLPLDGSLSLLGVATLFYCLVCVTLGFLTARYSSDSFQALVTCMLLIFPELFLSGGMGPSGNWPEWMQGAARLNPLFYFVDLIRGSLVMGLGWKSALFSVLALGIMCIILLAVSLRQSRKALLDFRFPGD